MLIFTNYLKNKTEYYNISKKFVSNCHGNQDIKIVKGSVNECPQITNKGTVVVINIIKI